MVRLKFLARAFICVLEEVVFAGDPTSLARDNILSHAREAGSPVKPAATTLTRHGP